MNKWAGKHQLSFDQYHKIPDQWQAEALIELHRQLGGEYDLANTPRSVRPKDSYRFAANNQAVWYHLADGVRTGDLACLNWRCDLSKLISLCLILAMPDKVCYVR